MVSQDTTGPRTQARHFFDIISIMWFMWYVEVLLSHSQALHVISKIAELNEWRLGFKFNCNILEPTEVQKKQIMMNWEMERVILPKPAHNQNLISTSFKITKTVKFSTDVPTNLVGTTGWVNHQYTTSNKTMS
ncbi:unnamed protein product [Ambrosiozyma monospora]|uniref:Unnamed protein product n=1 Tax=Ambrosiozyma monospora TaxID=43982 RepID=A0ACB5ST64_AMBMO|nr:unnamed protein product [Ambrosiozyma monospora]